MGYIGVTTHLLTFYYLFYTNFPDIQVHQGKSWCDILKQEPPLCFLDRSCTIIANLLVGFLH